MINGFTPAFVFGLPRGIRLGFCKAICGNLFVRALQNPSVTAENGPPDRFLFRGFESTRLSCVTSIRGIRLGFCKAICGNLEMSIKVQSKNTQR